MPQGQYVIQLSDYAALPSLHPLRFLLRDYLTEQTVKLSSQFDGVGVIVDPAAGRDWPSAVQVALSADMPCGYPIRIFERKNGRWSRIRPEGQAAYKPAQGVGDGRS